MPLRCAEFANVEYVWAYVLSVSLPRINDGAYRRGHRHVSLFSPRERPPIAHRQLALAREVHWLTTHQSLFPSETNCRARIGVMMDTLAPFSISPPP